MLKTIVRLKGEDGGFWCLKIVCASKPFFCVYREIPECPFPIGFQLSFAHSITLSLATLGVFRFPSRLVESTIAASVIVAALNNIRPVLAERGWIVAFSFGLVHGFGFANVLMDLGLAPQTLALALVGFNLGVELGQLAIVGAFLPLAFWLRDSWAYQRLTFRLGSAIIALLAATWMVERMFDIKWWFNR